MIQDRDDDMVEEVNAGVLAARMTVWRAVLRRMSVASSRQVSAIHEGPEGSEMVRVLVEASGYSGDRAG